MLTFFTYILVAIAFFAMGWLVCYRWMLKTVKEEAENLSRDPRTYPGYKDYSGTKVARTYSGWKEHSRRAGDIEEYIFGDYSDANNVLTSLSEFADKYGHASVADYHDLIKVTSNFRDNDRGWSRDTIKFAKIFPFRHGYIIDFPQVEDLGKEKSK